MKRPYAPASAGWKTATRCVWSPWWICWPPGSPSWRRSASRCAAAPWPRWGAELALLPQVLTVAVVIGPQDLEIQVVARDLAELATTLTELIAKTAGVGRITPGLALQILKYESTWVPF